MALVAAPNAFGAATTVYDNIANPIPGNVPSVGAEAYAFDEFGGQVGFASTERHNPRLTVLMSSWGCESGTWNGGDCSTSPTARFPVELRFNVYRVGPGDEPGRLIGKVTHTYNIPYRPSANYTKCNGANAGKWWSSADAKCYNGKAVRATNTLGGLDLPDKAIISVEYNTTHYGYDPLGESEPCFTDPGGCGYDSLNIGLGDGDPFTPEGEPTVGTQPVPDDDYQSSPIGAEYCDGGTGGTDVFRLDAGCWTGYQPEFTVTARP
jgi:hypothetical protein